MYPEFKKIPALQVSGGAMLMVPWRSNPTVLVYNKNKIKTPPTSYEVLLDKQYKGHVGFSDQHEFLWPVAAYLLGYDPFKMNKEQLGRAGTSSSRSSATRPPSPRAGTSSSGSTSRRRCGSGCRARAAR